MTTLALFAAAPAVVDSTDAQCTPLALAQALGHFDTDPCSNPRSHIQATTRYMLETGHDGLAEPWVGSVYANWPFSDPLPWCQRLRDHDAPWCGLGKLDPTTAWWRELMASGCYWAPFRARLKFEKPGNVGSADFPCALFWRSWKPSRAVLNWIWRPRRER